MGGTTPLSAGLVAALAMIQEEQVRNPDLTPLLILITEGFSNIARGDMDPLQESLQIAQVLRARGIASVALDTEGEQGRGPEIARALGAKYIPLGYITQHAILDALRPHRFASSQSLTGGGVTDTALFRGNPPVASSRIYQVNAGATTRPVLTTGVQGSNAVVYLGNSNMLTLTPAFSTPTTIRSTRFWRRVLPQLQARHLPPKLTALYAKTAVT